MQYAINAGQVLALSRGSLRASEKECEDEMVDCRGTKVVGHKEGAAVSVHARRGRSVWWAEQGSRRRNATNMRNFG